MTSAPSQMAFAEHGNKGIISVQLQDSGGYAGHILSGSVDGEICVIDPRKQKVIKNLSVGQGITGLAFHRRAFIFAAWAQVRIS